MYIPNLKTIERTNKKLYERLINFIDKLEENNLMNPIISIEGDIILCDWPACVVKISHENYSIQKYGQDAIIYNDLNILIIMIKEIITIKRSLPINIF